ncbi:cobalt-zinc-cadmium efflux system membrane fusion protein [Pontibacter ummariensis]|uniref:Membrane fusion protein, cobalt-zinc-cadmium efflux system n=1 Tax=Pontibacter ummariensis TaxID=1610492 RepID=A0A239D9A7_9BACT|nr:efflux RND transporter periplasmic adaptor subunit [Pontibacter ummariensis]PRY14313.1 cobalt-zinc-cadmium efflux system membrane fusion protein [Pontibacter ummariensis]SNS28925.1 membrane fusion protein, cobalt-zinc-cadmium efflux system [Pontibacter ummariensis]
MKRIIKNSLVLFVASFLFFQCSESEPVAEEEHGHEKEAHGEHTEEESEEGVVELSGVQLSAADLQYGELGSLNLSAYVKANGVLDLPPQNLAAVSAPSDGFVRKANYLVGDYVQKGTVLAVLENMDYVQFQEEYQQVLSNLSYLEAEYQRQRRLDSAQVSSKKQFQIATAAYENARSRKKALEEQLRYLGISPAQVAGGNISRTIAVRAPLSGYITKLNVHNGEFASSEQELYELADTRHMHLELNVFEQDANKVKIGQPIRFTVPSMAGEVYEGEVFLVGKAFDPENKTVKVHGHIEGEHPDFIRGLYVEAKIYTGKEQVQALPVEAVVEDEGKSYIFILTDDVHEEGEGQEAGEHGTSFRRVQVTTGETDQGFVEITQMPDLPAGAQIVTKGAYYLIAEMKKGEGGHHH